MIVTRDEIVMAANGYANNPSSGLCRAFHEGPCVCRCDSIGPFLEALGAKRNTSRYYWGFDSKAIAERLTFLAFMLAWHDDITGHRP